MSQRPWMPLYINDFCADTLDLNADQVGVYLTLLMLAWRREDAAIPDDMEWLKKTLKRCFSEFHGHQFNRIVPVLLERYFTLGEDGKWRNKRLTNERQKADKLSAKQQQNADKRWSKDKENKGLSDASAYAGHMPSQSQSQSQKKDTEPYGSGAIAPFDPRKALFREGLTKLAAITGKTPNSCRSLVGKWLSAVADEAIHVLGWIEEAERNRIADPVGWIEKQIQIFKGERNGQGRGVQTTGNVIAAADKLLERMRDFDRPAPSQRGVFDGAGTPPLRAIPKG